MKPPVPRLFLKIFLWFWSTLLISAFSVVATFVFFRPTIASRWQWRWVVALIASAFICYLLAQYLTEPIVRLRRAAHQLAAGNLQTRAVGMDHRSDEFGELVRDFNVMAARIEVLVSRQRQLIFDISHELRSPLARLNVALDLARERKGSDPSFDHMQHDIERLNEMIGRLLTIARLDTAATPLAMTSVDLSELVAQIAHDAGFEASRRNVEVAFSSAASGAVTGNAELLSSAIENVVRNAVHYTDRDSSVAIALQPHPSDPSGFVVLLVRDSGPGVPTSELTNIFLPFFRTNEGRDRKSGGAGLGLAIADRVVRAHGGAITAANLEPHGLEIRVTLPLAQ